MQDVYMNRIDVMSLCSLMMVSVSAPNGHFSCSWSRGHLPDYLGYLSRKLHRLNYLLVETKNVLVVLVSKNIDHGCKPLFPSPSSADETLGLVS